MSPNRYYCTQLDLEPNPIGSGSFGSVYRGVLNNRYVAVKINSTENHDTTTKEVNRMKFLDHPNIVKLLGIVPTNYHPRRCTCDDDEYDEYNCETTWIIMDYAAKGNLHNYITSYACGLNSAAMIKIAYQVAQGMWYLHKTANKVHMDLAARNVLVQDDDFNIKIGDFGVLCEYDYDYQETYYLDCNGEACPVRWMPPENFPNYGGRASYTRKGDVWSFGVLLFEIWSRGRTPFPKLGNESVMSVVRKGKTVLNYYKLHAAAWVLDLMNDCFEYDKTDRPNFRMISETIAEHM